MLLLLLLFLVIKGGSSSSSVDVVVGVVEVDDMVVHLAGAAGCVTGTGAVGGVAAGGVVVGCLHCSDHDDGMVWYGMVWYEGGECE